MRSYSQVGQDLFVLSSLKDKTNGYFLDIGSGPPISNNNTYLLESEYGWSGILFDIDQSYINETSRVRTSKLITCDATNVDYLSILEAANSPKIIDYISFDLDPAENTLISLMSFPLKSYPSRVITFEHDFYRFGERVRNESREYLTSLGYKLEVKDVCYNSQQFEDWYTNGT